MKTLTGVVHLRTLAADMKFKGRINPDVNERVLGGISATGGATIGYDLVPTDGDFDKYELRVMAVVAVNTDNFSRKIGHRLVQAALATKGQHAVWTLDQLAGDTGADLNQFVRRAESGEYYLTPDVFDIKQTVLESLVPNLVSAIFGTHPAAGLIKGADVINMASVPVELMGNATRSTSPVLVLNW